MTKSLPPVI